MEIYTVTLTKEEREELNEITTKGSHKSQKIMNALILLKTDKGISQKNRNTNEEITQIIPVSMKKIDRVKKRFVEEGLEVALNGHKSTGNYEKKVDGDIEAHLIALSCSQAPEGCRWTLRLLANKAVELGYVDGISHETVRQVLKKRN